MPTRFYKLRFNYTKRLFATYVLLSLLPLFFVTLILYKLAVSNIREASTDFVNLYVSQTEMHINNYISSLDNMTSLLLTDYDLHAYLANESKYSMTEKIDRNLQINHLLLGFNAQQPNVMSITLVSYEQVAHDVTSLRDPIRSDILSAQPWYRDIWESSGELILTAPHPQPYRPSSTRTEVLTVGRVIMNRSSETVGVILIDMAPGQLFEFNKHFAKISEMYDARIQLHTREGTLIYDTSTMTSEPEDTPQGNKYVTSDPDPNNYVQLSAFLPQHELQRKVDLFKIIVAAIACGVILFVSFFSLWISRRFTKPVHLLMTSMKHVESGLYVPIPERNLNDEFGMLTRAYNAMVLKIKYLIEDVYMANIKKNEAQYRALQRQIDPHMLYNTLESIRVKAELKQAPEVATMIKVLGKMFRIALKQEDAPHCIRDEIEHVRTYLHLQNIRYNNRFSLDIELNEGVSNVPIIRMVLQPIVENSVTHGFLEYDRFYQVAIRGHSAGDCVILTVKDDGAGIVPDRLQALRASLNDAAVTPMDWPDKSDNMLRIGLRNVHERIGLQFGATYGLKVDSEPGKGTTVEIRIPDRSNDHSIREE